MTCPPKYRYRVKELDIPMRLRSKTQLMERGKKYLIEEFRPIGAAWTPEDADMIVEALNYRDRYAQGVEANIAAAERRVIDDERGKIRALLRKLAYNITCDPFGIKRRAIENAADLL